MDTATSRDGTTIAYQRIGAGAGAPIIMVVGAFNDHQTGASLAAALAEDFTVYTYDRRGRGESGDTLPYAVEREVDDLAALIGEAGGAAGLFGFSSGAVLSLKAAQLGLPVTKVALYDTPIRLRDPEPESTVDIAKRLDELVSAGRRGEAVELFQTDVVGIPAEVVAQMRHAPFRAALETMAHTTVYDVTIAGDPAVPAGLASVPVPTLALAGGAGPEFMQRSAQAIAEAVPHGRCRILDGQSHDLVPEALAPVLREFFTDPA